MSLQSTCLRFRSIGVELRVKKVNDRNRTRLLNERPRVEEIDILLCFRGYSTQQVL